MERQKDVMQGKASVASLELLLNSAEGAEAWWREDELGEILQHQLEAPLVFDLPDCKPNKSQSPSVPRNFAELLFGVEPPLPLLHLMKEFAKSSDLRSSNPLPTPVAILLYYAAILAARMRHGKQISTLSQEDLESGIAWAARQSWVDGRTRAFFQAGLDSFG